ncbi:hypothetical protein NDI56_06625 [Haloarcula sp. S1CR25-12]|uniref:Uncharacterized protein n=1 Tax=Haloarcula saliterrae TaxID=2950534 RepID=A0ABU2F9Y0_9EURY|nr:hypothetical protein [Haloarcula sp. S1CR25-12]MDS0259064.1 hypothetical protein [Haloarcula sp. S1CR25-12]
MVGWIDLARGAVTLNILLLGVLIYVWGRNYYTLRSKHTLGLLLFAGLLLGENAFALYFYSLDPLLTAWFSSSVPDPAWQAMIVLHGFETVALVVLAWITWD